MWRQRLLKYRFGAPWQPFHNLHLLFLGLNKQKKKRTKGRLVRAFHQQASNVTYCGNKRLPRIFFKKRLSDRRLAWVTDVRTCYLLAHMASWNTFDMPSLQDFKRKPFIQYSFSSSFLITSRPIFFYSFNAKIIHISLHNESLKSKDDFHENL